jgi:hypothetical protein
LRAVGLRARGGSSPRHRLGLPKDVTSLGFVDVTPDVVGKQETLLQELLRRLGHFPDVSVVALVPLLKRLARIARGESLRVRGRERDPLPG